LAFSIPPYAELLEYIYNQQIRGQEIQVRNLSHFRQSKDEEQAQSGTETAVCAVSEPLSQIGS